MKPKSNRKKNHIGILLHEKFLQDINVKLVCLLFAIMMYLLIAFSELSEKTFIKKLEIVGLKSDLIISSPVPENIKIVVKDKKKVVNKLSEDDFRVKLDLTGIESTQENVGTSVKLDYTIPKSMSSFFSSITVIPDSLLIDVENVKEKNVPIVVPTAGNIRPGYIVKEVKVAPYEIRIQGPESVIDSIKKMETERVDITDEYESFERYIKISNKNPKIKIMSTQSENVTVYFVITKKMDIKTIKIEKVYLDNLDPQFVGTVTNAPVVLTLTGTEAAITALQEDDIVLSIDCSNIFVPGSYSYKTIDMIFPSSITLSSMYPKIIELKITRRSAKTADSTTDTVGF